MVKLLLGMLGLSTSLYISDALGSSKLQPGNSKGQTFVVEKAGELTGVSLGASVGRAGDLFVAIHSLKGNTPIGDPIAKDEIDLSQRKLTGIIPIEFENAVTLQPGKYALVLKTKTSDIVLSTNSADAYPKGNLIRNNQSTQGEWKPGNGKGIDLVMALEGSIELKIEPDGKSRTQNKELPIEPAEIQRHTNPDYTPIKGSQLPTKPNLVVCMVDDLGWNQIGVPQATMGTQQPLFTTPTLARMATEGLSFTYAYSQPNCAPTRAAMLSGQYPARVHNDVYVVGSLKRNGRGGISSEEARFTPPNQTEDVAAEAVTIAEALKENGYATAHIGKYHVGGHDGEETLPENVGFDINIGGFSQGHQPVCFARENGEGEWEFPKLGRGHFDRFGEPYTREYLKKYSFPKSLLGKPKHVSDALADAMEETIGKFAADSQPFYLQLHPYAVHGPVRSRPDLKTDANGNELAGFVSSIDLILTRLLKLLRDPNWDGDESDSIADHTLVLFTSDNGGTHGHNQPLRGKKGMFTEGGIRVPLIAYWPGVIPKNTVSEYRVHSVDYYPTLLELAGNTKPDPDKHPLDGFSFVDILLNPNSRRTRDPIFYFFPGYMDTRAQPCATVIDGKDKLIYFYESEKWELYNIETDISEQNNLIATDPNTASRLSLSLHSWLEQKHETWKPKYAIEKETGKPTGPPPIIQETP